MMEEQLKTLHLDIEKGIYELNGRDISKSSYLNLIFDNGDWSLMITEDSVYSTSDHRSTGETPYETVAEEHRQATLRGTPLW